MDSIYASGARTQRIRLNAFEDGSEATGTENTKSDVVQEDLSFIKTTIGTESTVTEPTQVKVLGMAWDTAGDTFLFNLEELIEYAKSLSVTKRSLLRWLSKIFDPLGLSPFPVTVYDKVENSLPNDMFG